MGGITALLRGERATRALGEAVGRQCGAGDVIALVGPLGAGKTTFTQGLARGLAIPQGDTVRSPSFTLCNEYACTVPVLHYDLYRLNSPEEADDIGFRDRVGQEAIAVVEWADLFPELIPSHALWVLLEHEEQSRRVTLWEGPGGDISWARTLPTADRIGASEWKQTARHGPWGPPPSA